MALLITEDCTNCGDCEPDCPNHAISAGDSLFIIDPNKCTECVGYSDESQCIDVCRYDCIIPDPAHQETKAHLQEKYEALARQGAGAYS